MMEINAQNLNILGVYVLKRSAGGWDTHGRDFSVLSIRLKGVTEFRTKNSATTVKENDVAYFPPYADYSQYSEGEEVLCVHFTAKTQDDASTEPIFEFHAEDLREKFLLLYETFREKRLGYRLQSLSILYDILYRLSSRRPDLPTRLRALIDENFTSPDFSVASLSKTTGFSPTYIRRIFLKTYGNTPSEYLIEQRLLYARNLLKSGYYKVYDAAFLSGYTDEKYFSVAFRRRFGIPPSKAIQKEKL